MKSLKKTLVLLVVFSMILSAVMPAFAATDVYGLDCEEEVARLEALKVVSGYEDGTFQPENTITRAEMAVILCKMVGIDAVTVDENQYVPSKFSDVAAGQWYTGYVNVAAGKGLLSGFPDGTFRPSEQLTMNQVLTLCVNALGRGEYVAEMGTWPANYIAEATKLGLLDGVKTSDANRGNVAMIVWNTLEAPYVWDVEATEFEGTINLMNSKRSLLSIYFRDYTYGSDSVRELKEVETVVASTPNRNAEIGDRQIVLPAIEEDFDFKTTFKKKDVKEECTYATFKYVDDEDAEGNPIKVKVMDTVVAYVPEEVYEDLDSLRGKNVTVVFGKDNVVAMIVVEDEIVEDEFLTKYAAEDNKIVVGGETYKLVKGYDVVLNDKEYADLDAALAELTMIDDVEDIEKHIQAQLTLDIDGKVEKVALFASANIANVSTETVVTKVRETSKKYKIETKSGKDIEWNLDDEEDLDFPRVYVDGAKGDIRDIEAGNVVTVLGSDFALENITAIYVSTNTVVGDATKVRKTDSAITIDGEMYLASKEVENNTVDMIITEEIDDEWTPFDRDTVLDNEEVTLYMNIFGEYVVVAAQDVVSDYQFGIVTYKYGVDGECDYEVEDDEEYAYRNLRILTTDGSVVKYKVTTNIEDDETPNAAALTAVVDRIKVGSFIMFKASDKVITLKEDLVKDTQNAEVAEEILLVSDYTANAKALGNDYTVKSAAEGKVVKAKAKTFKLDEDQDWDTTDDVYEGVITSKTVIFNNFDKTVSEDENREVVTDWKSIIEWNQSASSDVIATTDGAATFVFGENNDEEALYIVVDMGDYASSDAEYAIVDKKLDDGDDDTWTIGFVGSEEPVEVDDAEALVGKADGSVEGSLENAKNWFISYTTESGKIDAATKLINLDAFAKLEEDELVAAGIINDTQLAKDGANAIYENYTKNHLEVAFVEEDEDAPYIQYVDDVDKKLAIADIIEAGEYFEFVKLTSEAKFDANETYYSAATVEDDTVTAENFATKVGANLYVAVIAEEYVIGTTYYTLDAAGDFAEISATVEKTLGKVWLEPDHITVIDVSEGEVKEASLADAKGRTVIVFADADCKTADGNIVIILD